MNFLMLIGFVLMVPYALCMVVGFGLYETKYAGGWFILAIAWAVFALVCFILNLFILNNLMIYDIK